MENPREKAVCPVCPRACALMEGERGFCRARVNRGGCVVPAVYGAMSALALDPIEKKPFYHFCPGSHILSIGGCGCNMRCFFCQNHAIAQAAPEGCETITPALLASNAEMLVARGNVGVAYTYNEPGVSFEFVRDASRCVQEKGMVNAMVTNGYLTPYALDTLLDTIDAWNIDLKCFTGEGYARLGGSLSTVCKNIARAAAAAHVEVTTLIVPGLSDGEADMAREADFLAGISPDIPLHISRYFPRYKADVPATPEDTLHRLAKIAKKSLRHVYLGNI